MTICVFLVWAAVALPGTSSTASGTPTLGESRRNDARRRLRAGRARAGGAAPGRHARPLGRRGRARRLRVVPQPWLPGPARVDAEYQADLDGDRRRRRSTRRARGCRRTSRRSSLVHHARSAPAGLLEVAEEHDAGLIVLGSSLGGRARARVARQRQRPAACTARPSRSRWRRAGSAAARLPGAAGDGGVRRLRGADDLVVGRRAASRHGSARRCASRPSRSGRGRRTRPASDAAEARTSIVGRSRTPAERPGASAAAGDGASRDRGRPRRDLGRGDRGRRVGTTATCSWSARARSGRSRASSSARARRRSSATRRCRSSSSRAKALEAARAGRPPPGARERRRAGRAAAPRGLARDPPCALAPALTRGAER